LLLLAITPINAHTELISSNPKPNSTIQVAPATISFNFSETPLLIGTHVYVQQPVGKNISTVAPKLLGSTLSIPWPQSAKPGKIFVIWRTVADDGHISKGKFQFNYIKAPAPTVVVTSDSNNGRKFIAFALIGLLLLGAILFFAKSKLARNKA